MSNKTVRLSATLAVVCGMLVPVAVAGAPRKAAPGKGGTTTTSSDTTTGCNLPATTQAFAAFGDSNDYYLAPGGDFESGISWAKSGSADLASPNEPFYLAGSGHAKSLQLGSGGMVTTPKLCVSPDTPHMRFMAKSVGGSGQLDVTVRYWGQDGGEVTDSSGGGVGDGDHRSWAPSDPIDLKVSNLDSGETGYVDIVFYGQGTWLIDDLFIDPRASR